jgi:hypothetical protein
VAYFQALVNLVNDEGSISTVAAQLEDIEELTDTFLPRVKDLVVARGHPSLTTEDKENQGNEECFRE